MATLTDWEVQDLQNMIEEAEAAIDHHISESFNYTEGDELCELHFRFVSALEQFVKSTRHMITTRDRERLDDE